MVYLAADTFNYTFRDRCAMRMRRFATEQWPDSVGKRVNAGLPKKVMQSILSTIYMKCAFMLGGIVSAVCEGLSRC